MVCRLVEGVLPGRMDIQGSPKELKVFFQNKLCLDLCGISKEHYNFGIKNLATREDLGLRDLESMSLSLDESKGLQVPLA